MSIRPPDVSVLAPVNPAIEHVKKMLFRPFDLGKWITIGFCAWLANLGQGGTGYSHSSQSKNVNLGPEFERGRAYFFANLSWILPLAAVVLVLFLVAWVAILWLRSRGQFMLLHCIALDRAEVAVPWRKFAREAKGLWLFRLMLTAAGFIVGLPVLATFALIMFKSLGHKWLLDPGSVNMLIPIGLIWFCIVLALVVAGCFTSHFVSVIMFLRGGTCTEGWRVFLELLKANASRFFLYLLFQVILLIALGLVIILCVLCTCCIGALFLMIPFVGTVVMLPVTVFLRSYSLYYFAQYGPEFDVFHASSEALP